MPPKASRRPASPYSGHDKGTTSTRATNAKRQKKGHDDNELNKHLDSGLFSDFTIICGERKFNVHRIILASKGGSFFANLLSSGMQETHEQKCDLSADDVDVVEGMIQFMYDQDIQRERQENEALEDAIRYYVDLFVLADKYQILALQRAVKDVSSHSCSVARPIPPTHWMTLFIPTKSRNPQRTVTSGFLV